VYTRRKSRSGSAARRLKQRWIYGHLFEGSDKESAERIQKLFGNRPASVQVSTDIVVIRQPQRKKA
jgi:hypothetical protein